MTATKLTMTATTMVYPVAVMVMFCGPVAVMVCGRHCYGRHGDGLWPSWFVAVVAADMV